MGPFGIIAGIACLAVLRWVLWGTAALLVVLVVVQAMRGDDGARPDINGTVAALLGLFGWLSGRASARLHG